MIKEYDVVKATSFINDTVYEGTRGAVLMVYNSNLPVYEVEFVDKKGEAIAIVTVSASQIELDKG